MQLSSYVKCLFGIIMPLDSIAFVVHLLTANLHYKEYSISRMLSYHYVYVVHCVDISWSKWLIRPPTLDHTGAGR